MKEVYNMLLSNKHESICMHVSARDERELGKTIKTAITSHFCIFFNQT